ncbi:molecular chaperone HtpG [Blastochloris sulfoviridis]|uniref:Chaperone protein HtpG n=1 Tax=Blastochloris sulfoviridis TaxID=50712 RepID=A0A5M6I1R9_9HYPH|nr:molecular chaperone HtpG [Blastochloris sulfoviridis]KAA5602146.1 molecular chaperone HtpG [Blastochloris sulfoviridis]
MTEPETSPDTPNEASRHEAAPGESRAFAADVARLLHMMVHSVYSDRDVFLRELISNAADACERLRYEAIANPDLLGDDPKPRITLAIDADARRLTLEDNGIGMSRPELIEALGTIAHSGTKAFLERLDAAQGDTANLIGQFGVGFYSAFMVADKVDVISRRAGSDEAWQWSSDGKGTYTVTPVELAEAPARGTRVVLHLMADATSYTERFKLQRIIKDQSGHVPVPITLIDKPGGEASEVTDGAALWTKPKSEITAEEYTDFYRSAAGQFDTPALTIHVHAEGRQEYSLLAFVPSVKPFDLSDPERKGRLKLYVKRVFITDDAEIVPRYLRFVRGLVDSTDLPLNVSREMIQESPILAAIRKSVTGRVLSELEKLAGRDETAYADVWANFGAVLKEGLCEDFERREALLGLARFKTTASGEGWRSLKDYAGALRENQTAIYYIAGDDADRLAASPHLEGFRARGIEVLLLSDSVDSFWVTLGPDFEGKPFKSVTQGAADLAAIPLLDASAPTAPEVPPAVADLLAFIKTTLGDDVADVRASDRLTDSAVCLVASEAGLDRQLEKILSSAGRLGAAAKPILEVNPRHDLIVRLAGLGETDAGFRADVAHLLLDEARILDGERPGDAKSYAARLGRVIGRSLGASTS